MARVRGLPKTAADGAGGEGRASLAVEVGSPEPATNSRAQECPCRFLARPKAEAD